MTAPSYRHPDTRLARLLALDAGRAIRWSVASSLYVAAAGLEWIASKVDP